MARVLMAAIVGLAVTIGGCSSGGGGPSLAALQQAFQQCSQGSMYNLLRLINGAGAVVAVAQGQFPQGNVTVDFGPSSNPSDPPNTFIFTVGLDTNANGAFDTFLVGKATFSEDPTDGLLPGSSVALVFAIENTPRVAGNGTETGTLTGDVDVTVTFNGPEQASLAGTVVLNDSAGGCSANLGFPQLSPLQLTFPEPILGGPIMEANLAGIEMFGQINAALTALGQSLEAVITITGGTQQVTVVGLVNAIEINLTFDIFPAPEVIVPLARCLEDILDLAGAVVESLADVAELELADLVAGNVPGVTLTPTGSPTVFNYTIDLEQFGESGLANGMLTGQATLTFAGLEVSRVSVTWNLLAEGFLSGINTISGQNNPGRPLVINLDTQGDVASLYGAGSFTTPECTGSFDVPVNAPLIGDGESGEVNFAVGAEGNTLLATLQVGIGFAFSDIVINGIAVPADLFAQYLFFFEEAR